MNENVNEKNETLMSSKDDDNENENENEKDETLMSSKDENEKTSNDTKRDKNKNILLEYMGDVDDKLFKIYSNG